MLTRDQNYILFLLRRALKQEDYSGLDMSEQNQIEGPEDQEWVARTVRRSGILPMIYPFLPKEMKQ